MDAPVRSPDPSSLWSDLSPTDKRARALVIADELFAREGLSVPMPAVADAIGVGVGSLYRQIGKKDDLIAALVIARVDRVRKVLDRALDSDGDVWETFCDVVQKVVGLCVSDHLSQEAWEMTIDRSDVLEARARLIAAVERLVARARETGEISPAATEVDVRLLFKAATAAERLTPGGARRLAELALAGLRADAPVVTGASVGAGT